MTSLDLSFHSEEVKLSPQQKKFNRLIQKIEQKKHDLEEWREAQVNVQQHAQQELLLVYEEWHQLLFKQLEILWAQLHQFKFAKTHQTRLDEKIYFLSQQLRQTGNLSAEQQQFIEKILAHYQPHLLQDKPQEAEHFIGSDAELELELEMKKHFIIEMLSDQLELEADWFDFDFDPDDTDDLMQKVKQKLDVEEAEFIRENLDDQERIAYEKFAQREKNKAMKQQAKLEEAQQIAKQSLKILYLKIASVIHPDREQDEQKRIEKTELLQQANQALEDKDLLTLLKLKALIDQNGVGEATKQANEQLKMYNLLLEDQLNELESEIDDIVYSFDWESSGFYKNNYKVADLTKKYQRDLEEVLNRVNVDQMRLEQYSDINTLKSLIKSRMFSFTF